MYQLVVLIRERGWEDKKWTDYFKIKITDNPEQHFRNAVKEYLLTEEGKEDIKQTCEDFNWGDALMYVPEKIWNKHGIFSVAEGDTVTISNPLEIFVNQDEVLIPTEYYESEC